MRSTKPVYFRRHGKRHASAHEFIGNEETRDGWTVKGKSVKTENIALFNRFMIVQCNEKGKYIGPWPCGI